MTEIWKDIPDYEGLYQASNLGRIKSLKFGKEKILKHRRDNKGYYSICLCKNGIPKNYKVHRIVYETFNGKTDLDIDHIIEGNKFDNRLCNLQALTTRQNTSKYFLNIKKTSRYIGVYYNKRRNRWHSRIKINGKMIHVGYFKFELDAANAYQAKLSELSHP